MNKILLTGGKGFFCSRFAKCYNNDFDIIAVGRQDFDVSNESAVRLFVDKHKPDIVIHGAALVNTDFCNNNPKIAHEVNVVGAVNIAKACKENETKLVFISTEQVFNGNIDPGPYSEDTTPKPNTVYGQNKLEAENIIKDMYEKVWIVRFAWMFGMPQIGCGMSGNIMWDTIKAMIKNEKIYASPNEYRSVTYVEDMIKNTEKLLDIPYGTYHFSAHNELSRYETIKHMLKQMGLSNRIEELLVKDEQKYSDYVRDARLNSNKLDEYKINFEDSICAISRCIKDYKLVF